MIILGVDPGSTRMGIGIIETVGQKFKTIHYGLLLPEKELVSLPTHEKLPLIYESLKDIIKTYKPSVVGIETLIFARNVTTAFVVAYARAMILLVAGEEKIPLLELSPTQIKKGISSVGNANKKQVAFMVRHILGISKDEKILDDITDALAISIVSANYFHSKVVLKTSSLSR